MYVRTYIHTYVHTYVCTYVCTYMHSDTKSIHTYIDAQILHMYVHTVHMTNMYTYIQLLLVTFRNSLSTTLAPLSLVGICAT